MQFPFRKTHSTGVQAGPYWTVTFGVVTCYSGLSDLIHCFEPHSLLRSHCLLVPFILWGTTAFTAHHILSTDVNDLMVSRQLAEICSQFYHSSAWTIIKRKPSRPLSTLVLFLFLALYWDLATASETRSYFVCTRSAVILWDVHLSCLLWHSGLCSNIPSES